jgi:hypothetical protein
MVSVAGEFSSSLQPIVQRVIADALVSNTCGIILQAQALQLWLDVVRNSALSTNRQICPQCHEQEQFPDPSVAKDTDVASAVLFQQLILLLHTATTALFGAAGAFASFRPQESTAAAAWRR